MISFLKSLYHYRYAFYQLTKRDFLDQYVNSYLGLVWTLIQPSVFIGIMWFVTSYGFREGKNTPGEAPFIAYLFVGKMAWDFFSGMFSRGTHSIRREYSYLIRQPNFDLRIIPLVKISTVFLYHLIFMGLVFIVLVFSGVYPSLSWFSLIYYFLAAALFMTGVTFLTSALNVFIPDIGQATHVIIQAGFWITPIFWKIEMLSEKVRVILKLNPAYFLVDGYRNAMLNQTWFWEQEPWLHIYFWSIVLIFLIIGNQVFSKMRMYFIEVL